MCRQLLIALATCLLLPLLGLELLFSGPDLVGNATSPSRPLGGCNLVKDQQVFYVGDLLDDVMDSLHWSRVAEQAAAAVVFVGDWRQVEWKSLNGACHRVNAMPLDLPFLNKGDFAATMGARRAENMANVPDSFLLYHPKQCADLWAASPGDGVWTVRHTHRRPGEKVFVGTLDDLRHRFRCDKPALEGRHFGLLAQRYINPPLLLDGRKCEVRAYFAVANVAPWILLYHRGYWRLNKAPYSDRKLGNEDSQTVKAQDSSSRWTFEAASHHLNQLGRPKDWVENTLEPLLRTSFLHVFHAYRSRVPTKPGTFLLLGADFLVTNDLTVHFLDIQVSPELGLPDLKSWMVPMLKELLLIEEEIRTRLLQGRRLEGLRNPLHWHVLWNEADRRP